MCDDLQNMFAKQNFLIPLFFHTIWGTKLRIFFLFTNNVNVNFLFLVRYALVIINCETLQFSKNKYIGMREWAWG